MFGAGSRLLRFAQGRDSGAQFRDDKARAHTTGLGGGDRIHHKYCWRTDSDKRGARAYVEIALVMGSAASGAAAQFRSRGPLSGTLDWHGGQVIQAPAREPGAAKLVSASGLGR